MHKKLTTWILVQRQQLSTNLSNITKPIVLKTTKNSRAFWIRGQECSSNQPRWPLMLVLASSSNSLWALEKLRPQCEETVTPNLNHSNHQCTHQRLKPHLDRQQDSYSWQTLHPRSNWPHILRKKLTRSPRLKSEKATSRSSKET